MTTPSESQPNSQRLATPDAVGASVAAAGFLFLVVSPFLYWFTMGTRGQRGIAGDGQYLLGAAIVAAILFAVAFLRRPLRTHLLLLSQGISILAVFWMSSLLWRFRSLSALSDGQNHPLGGLVSVLTVRPAIGLYFGLLGAILVTVSAGYLAFRQPKQRAAPVVISQFAFAALGLLLMVYLNGGFSAQTTEF